MELGQSNNLTEKKSGLDSRSNAWVGEFSK